MVRFALKERRLKWVDMLAKDSGAWCKVLSVGVQFIFNEDIKMFLLFSFWEYIWPFDGQITFGFKIHYLRCWSGLSQM